MTTLSAVASSAELNERPPTPRTLKAGQLGVAIGGDEMRAELLDSLRSVDALADAVHADAVAVRELGMATLSRHPRALRFLRGVAFERLFEVVGTLRASRLGASWVRWVRHAKAARKAEKRAAFARYQGGRRLALGLRGWVYGCLGRAWAHWYDHTVAIRNAEIAAREYLAALQIQNAWRYRKSRMLLAHLKRLKRMALEQKSSKLLQRMERGRAGRARAAAARSARARQRAALCAQMCLRAALARRTLQRLQLLRRRTLSAVVIQRVAHGAASRRVANARRVARDKRLACEMMQRNYRGRLGRRKAVERKQFLYETAIVAHVQKVVRGALARKRFRVLVADVRAHRVVEEAAALLIQRVFRGHKGRVRTRLTTCTKKSREERKIRSAVEIQRTIRGFVARRVVGRRLVERHEGMLRDARLWIERANDETAELEYEHAEHGDVVTEPPLAGYTRLADGMLVLADGKVLVDPLEQLTPEERRKKELASKYCWCEEKEATRNCNECAEKFCTDCWVGPTHGKGARARHTWTRIGRPVCEHCVKVFAQRWCTDCDEPYCMGCWGEVHYTKASLQTAAVDVAAGRTPRYVSSCATAHCYQEIDKRKGTIASEVLDEVFETGGDAKEDAAPDDGWIALADDEGTPYWYNKETGASSYDDPHAPGWVDPNVALPTYGDWAQFDDGAGNLYWYNDKTQESSYDAPEGYSPS